MNYFLDWSQIKSGQDVIVFHPDTLEPHPYNYKKQGDSLVCYEEGIWQPAACNPVKQKYVLKPSNRSDEIQILEYNTLAGIDTIKAPRRFDFCKATTLMWVWLTYHSETLNSGSRTQKEIKFIEGKIYSLSQMLALLLGFSVFYWEQEAKREIYHK